MKYINKFFLSLLGLGCVVLASCSEEESLTPGSEFPNYFLPETSDKSPEAELRRDFYNESGIYLLFNDTLAVFTDEYGVERTEMLDIAWSLNSQLVNLPTWDYLEDYSESEAALKGLRKYFLPNINFEKCSWSPYSIFLVKNLQTPDRWGDLYPGNFFSCWRTTIINAEGFLSGEENDCKNAATAILKQLVSEKFTDEAEVMQPFLAVCADLYDSYPAKAFPGWMDDQDITLIYDAGFMKYSPDSWGDPDYDDFPSKSDDINHFLDAVLTEDENTFREKWEDYPKIIIKYELMKQAIEDFGINLNIAE